MVYFDILWYIVVWKVNYGAFWYDTVEVRYIRVWLAVLWCIIIYKDTAWYIMA